MMKPDNEPGKSGKHPGWLERLWWWLPWAGVPEISPADLDQLLQSERGTVQLLDVRSRPEFSLIRIDGASNVPITRFPSMLDALSLDKSRPVVVICATAHRSIPAVRLLQRRGYQDLRQLAGGMIRWRRHRLPVETWR